MNEQSVILFPTSAHVMRAEKILKEAQISNKLIPIPRYLSSDCGFCLVVSSHDCARACVLLDTKKLIYDEAVPLSNQ